MAKQRSPHRRIATLCVLSFLSMLGLTYASVPFYTWFCQTTGFGGTPQIAQKAPQHIAEQTVKVRFDSNVSGDLPWRFDPKQREIRVKLGELATVSYVAENLSGELSAGMAIFNVSPDLAGGYFNKLECFCFTNQVLKPHEKRELSVTFFVDPDVVKDNGLSTLDTITLSYTFYSQRSQISQTENKTTLR
jgi:cytochrome c oxidase assembly protein subunit 11